MLGKVCKVCDRLLVGQVCQVVGCEVLEGDALPVVAVFYDDAETSRGIHQDLYDPCFEV